MQKHGRLKALQYERFQPSYFFGKCVSEMQAKENMENNAFLGRADFMLFFFILSHRCHSSTLS